MKKLNKKWLGFFSITAIIGVLTIIFAFAQPLTRSKAEGGAFGGASSNHTGGGGGGRAIAGGNWKSNGKMAFRIYFAPNTMDFNKNSSSYASFMTAEDGTSTYDNLEKYAQIGVYAEKDWEGKDTSQDKIHVWTRNSGVDGEIAFKDDLQKAFEILDSSDNLSPVNLKDGGSFDEFIAYCDKFKENETRDNIVKAYQKYIKYMADYSSYLSANQQSILNDLKAIGGADGSGVDNLMIICEPVFLSQIGGGNEYFSVSLSDWGYDWHYTGYYGGGIAETADSTGATAISTRVDKLSSIWADFWIDDTEFNVNGRWYGFAYYSSKVFDKNKIGIGINLNIEFNGEPKRNQVTSEGITTTLAETMTSPAKEDNGTNEKSSSFVGNPQYLKALQSWEGLASASSADSHTKSALYMAGWTWNQLAWGGNKAVGGTLDFIPWEGAWKYHALENLQETTDPSMKGRVSGSSVDYMLGVFGHMSADAIDAIPNDELLLTMNRSFRLNLGKTVGEYNMFYGNATNMNIVSDYVQNNIKMTTQETLATAKTAGYAYGSKLDTIPIMGTGDFVDEFGSQLVGAFNNSGLPVTGYDKIHDLYAESDDTGKIKGQGSSAETQETLSRIMGATVFANPISITQENRTDPVTVNSGAMTVSVNVLQKVIKVTNYLGASRIESKDGIDSPATYEFAETGRTYKREHPINTQTDWLINDTSTGTIANGGDQSVTFLVVWKNTDMTNSSYDFSKSIPSSATNITTDIAEYCTSHNVNITDEKSYSMFGDAFRSVTGVTPIGVTRVGTGTEASTTLALGSMFNSDDSVTGLSALVVTVGGEGNQYTETGDGLPAHMLNAIAPSSWGLWIDKPVYNWAYAKKDWNGRKRDWSVTDYLSGDLYNFGNTDLLYYNEEKGNFGSPLESEKWFGYNEKAYMSYAFNLPRSLWGDLPTVADYLGDGQNSVYQDFAQMMKFPVGDIATNGTTCNVGANVERTYPETKHDRHKFKCYVEWIIRIWVSDGHGGGHWEYPVKHASTSRTYDITHTMDKYTCMNRITARLDGDEANDLYYHDLDMGRDDSFTYKSILRNQSEKILSIYPEVRMLMQYAGGNEISSVEDVDTLGDLWVMGEKLRNFYPVSMRGIRIENQEGFEGQFTSNTLADGSRPSNLQENNLPVMYTGGNLNLHVNGIDNKIKLISYAIDFDDTSRNNGRFTRFSSSNEDYKPDEEHTAYVNGVLKNLGVDVTLDINSSDDGSDTKYRYHNFNTMMSQFTVSNTDTSQFKIYYKEGDIYKGSDSPSNYGDPNQYNELISDIVNEFGLSESEAEDYFRESGMIEQLQKCLESGNDEKNASHKVTDKESEYFNTEHWYDEKTSVFTVRKYVSYVSIGDVALSDKLDITVGDDKRTSELQQKANRDKLFYNGKDGGKEHKMFGKWYISMYLKNNIDVPDDKEVNNSQYEVLWEEKPIENTDFMVSDATTNDMRN